MKRTPHNDNDERDPMPFLSLAAITANVARYLRKQEQEKDGEGERGNGEADQRAESEAQCSELLVRRIDR